MDWNREVCPTLRQRIFQSRLRAFPGNLRRMCELQKEEEFAEKELSNKIIHPGKEGLVRLLSYIAEEGSSRRKLISEGCK